MSDNDLFPEAHSLSPKLKWLDKHGLKTIHNKRKGDPLPWRCVSANESHSRVGLGETEDDACIEYCLIFDIKHWTLE